MTSKDPMTSKDMAIATYRTHEEAESAIRQLQRGGFDMRKLSIVGKGYRSEEQPIGFYTSGERVKFWGGSGAVWGGLWGMLFGAAFFWVPGIGPLAIAGPLVASLVSALEGAVVVGGLSALGAALYSIGVPKDSIVRYETALKADKFLVIAHGDAADLKKAYSIMGRINTASPEILATH